MSLEDLRKNVISQCAKRKWPIACAFIYLVLALILTWPIIASPFSQVPIGTEPTASVPLYNVWATWWNADRLAGGLFGYWDAPIFHPTQGSFALMEPQPTTMVVAPIVWLTGSRILAYNVYVWICLVLNGVFAQRLAKIYGMGRWSALWAGAAMVLLPMVHWQLGIFQLASLWGILWTWSSIEQLCREPSQRRGVELGIAAALSFVSCMHHGLFLAILLVGAAPILWRQWIKFHELPHWGLAVVVALVITVPFVYQVNQVTEVHAIDWETDLVSDLSAKVSDYFHSPGHELINFGDEEQRYLFLSSGWLKYLLALAGICYGLKRIQTRRWASFLLAIAVLAFLLSLGPNLKLGSFQPWWWLTENALGFSRVRSVFRFAFFVQIPLIIFAALGLTGIHQLCRERIEHSKLKNALRWALPLLAITALADGFPRQTGNAEITDVNKHQEWLEYVEENTLEGEGILCLPVAPGPRVWQYLVTSEWMYLGTFHKVPIFNGYSSHFPQHYRHLRNQILSGFPTESILQQFHRSKVKFIVVRAKKGSPPRNIKLGDFWLKRVCIDELVEVYELGKSSP
ncbi:hypothetical protein GYB43_16525 [bacterium]|nr:hypothetical protein [bacterium]